MDPFSQAVWEFYSQQKLKPEEVAQRQELVTRLQLLLSSRVCQGAAFKCYGSQETGLHTRSSDIDLGFVFPVSAKFEREPPNRQRELVQLVLAAMAEELVKNGLHATPILQAAVPVVKCTDTITQIQCDIAHLNPDSLVNAHLIRRYTKVDSRVAPLLLAVKHWTKQRQINDASQGTLNSMGYCCMVIQYLQVCNPPVLPVLQVDEPKIRGVDSGKDRAKRSAQKKKEEEEAKYGMSVRRLTAFFEQGALEGEEGDPSSSGMRSPALSVASDSGPDFSGNGTANNSAGVRPDRRHSQPNPAALVKYVNANANAAANANAIVNANNNNNNNQIQNSNQNQSQTQMPTGAQTQQQQPQLQQQQQQQQQRHVRGAMSGDSHLYHNQNHSHGHTSFPSVHKDSQKDNNNKEEDKGPSPARNSLSRENSAPHNNHMLLNGNSNSNGNGNGSPHVRYNSVEHSQQQLQQQLQHHHNQTGPTAGGSRRSSETTQFVGSLASNGSILNNSNINNINSNSTTINSNNNNNTTTTNSNVFPQKNTSSVSELLLGFFSMFTSFEPDIYAVCIRTGHFVNKSAYFLLNHHTLCILDPAKPTNNVARAVNKQTWDIIQEEMRRSVYILTNIPASSCFDEWTRPVDMDWRDHFIPPPTAHHHIPPHAHHFAHGDSRSRSNSNQMTTHQNNNNPQMNGSSRSRNGSFHSHSHHGSGHSDELLDHDLGRLRLSDPLDFRLQHSHPTGSPHINTASPIFPPAGSPPLSPGAPFYGLQFQRGQGGVGLLPQPRLGGGPASSPAMGPHDQNRPIKGRFRFDVINQMPYLGGVGSNSGPGSGGGPANNSSNQPNRKRTQ